MTFYPDAGARHVGTSGQRVALSMTTRAAVATRAAHEFRLLAEAVRTPRACLPSLLVLLAGLGYLAGPIDLIPDRLPVIGHLDEAGFVAAGLAGAWLLLPTVRAERRGRPVEEMRARRRRAAAPMLAIASVPLLRLALGRFPTRAERRAFADALASGDALLPPLLRGLAALPAGDELLAEALLMAMTRRGEIPPARDLGRFRAPRRPHAGDVRKAWNGPPVAFLHFEKTAGVALASVLTGLFHPTQIDHDPHQDAPPQVLSAFAGTAGRRVGAKRLVWGHYDLPAIRRLGDGRRVVTVLREPRARILSLYHFWRAVEPELLSSGRVGLNVRAAHERDLLAFLRSEEPELRDHLDNCYVRRLTGLYVTGAAEDPLAAAPEAALEAARAALDSLAHVAVLERLDAGLPALGLAIGAPLPPTLPRRNVTAGAARGFRAVARAPLSPAVDAELERLTRLDVVLYAEACRALDAQPTSSRAEKKNGISTAAVSAASEPCTEFASMLSANSARMVPGSAFFGSVAPITER